MIHTLAVNWNFYISVYLYQIIMMWRILFVMNFNEMISKWKKRRRKFIRKEENFFSSVFFYHTSNLGIIKWTEHEMKNYQNIHTPVEFSPYSYSFPMLLFSVVSRMKIYTIFCIKFYSIYPEREWTSERERWIKIDGFEMFWCFAICFSLVELLIVAFFASCIFVMIKIHRSYHSCWYNVLWKFAPPKPCHFKLHFYLIYGAKNQLM